MQLDFFNDNSDVELMRREIADMKESQDKVRRGVFARVNEVQHQLVYMDEQIKRLKRELCADEDKILQMEMFR